MPPKTVQPTTGLHTKYQDRYDEPATDGVKKEQDEKAAPTATRTETPDETAEKVKPHETAKGVEAAKSREGQSASTVGRGIKKCNRSS